MVSSGLKNIIIASCLAVVFHGCSDFFEDPPANSPDVIFDDVWKTFNEEYAPFDERNVDWSAEYSRFRTGLDENSTDEELYNALTGLLATLDDGHVTLTVPGKEIFNSNSILREKIDDELFNTEIIMNNYLENDYRTGEEGSYVFGKIRGEDIGYILLDYIGDNLFVMKEFLDEFESARGLIIDLRHNQGGDFTFSFSEMGRLADTKYFIFRSKTKNGKGKNDYTPWKEWYFEPSGRFIDKPVVVLTDRYTISAGERTVMALRELPQVTVVGDTTSGAHGTMIGRETANGWYYSLVPQKVELADGRSLEGIGLPPDIFVRNELPPILTGNDEVLETAIELIK